MWELRGKFYLGQENEDCSWGDSTSYNSSLLQKGYCRGEGPIYRFLVGAAQCNQALCRSTGFSLWRADGKCPCCCSVAGKALGKCQFVADSINLNKWKKNVCENMCCPSLTWEISFQVFMFVSLIFFSIITQIVINFYHHYCFTIIIIQDDMYYVCYQLDVRKMHCCLALFSYKYIWNFHFRL